MRWPQQILAHTPISKEKKMFLLDQRLDLIMCLLNHVNA